MPIRPFLAGQPFEPKAIREMSDTLESVCGTLGIELKDDDKTRQIAATIIRYAQTGLRDRQHLVAAVLRDLKLQSG